MKLQLLAPIRIKARETYLIHESDRFVSAWGIVFEVAQNFRGYRALACETQKDLLRFCALNSHRVSVGLAGARAPFFYFERSVADAWLDQGGRAWIIAEMEARSARRVVAFPRGGRSA